MTKQCGHYEDERQIFIRRLCGLLIAFVVLVLFIIFLVWLILRPSKPSFVLQDVTVFAFNVSGPNLLTSTLQATVSTRNPNDRVGIYYDKLLIYVVYRNQQITLPTTLPPTYQGHKDVVVWSPFISGNAVPVAPYLAQSLTEDQSTGTVLVKIRIDGRVRWKVGTWISGRYHLHANCPAYITFGSRSTGIAVGPAIKYQMASACTVDV